MVWWWFTRHNLFLSDGWSYEVAQVCYKKKEKMKRDPNSLTERCNAMDENLLLSLRPYVIYNKYVSNNAMGMMAMAEKEVIYSSL